jgi:two-component sensor histidine kinase
LKLKNFTKTRFWIKLGQPNVIGHNLLFVAIIAVAILSFAFDAVRLKNYTFMWVPLNLAGAVIVLAVAIPVLNLKRSMNEEGRNQPIFNLTFAALCMGAKNYLILLLAPAFGIDDTGILYVRFIGGFMIGIGILVLYSNVVGTRIFRVNTLNELRSIEEELKKFRSAAFDELEDENRIAALNATVSLAPQLENLKSLVKESKELVYYTDRVSTYIKEQIKPFGEILSISARQLAQNRDSDSIPESEEEIRIRPALIIRIWTSFVPIPFSIYLLSTFTLPALLPIEAFQASLVFAVSLALCKLALNRLQELSISETFATVTVVAFVASIPSYLLLYGVSDIGGVPELMPVFLIIPAWSVLATSMASILDLWQSTTEKQLALSITELARENKLYEQKAWLARHGWYLVLHGVVQPALTSASIRAATSDQLTPEITQQIESDLQRALDALADNRPARVELAQGITNIQELWQGICRVELDVADSVFVVTNTQETAAQVLNEVLKEVVSNAVRHGNASKALIRINLDSYGDISIVAANDGKKPLGNIVESLGSRMLDAVCVERSLLWNEETEYTEFTATIPINHK